MLSGEVGKVAAEAGVGCLVLTHFVPPGCDRGALLAEVSADFAGPVVIGEDLLSLDATDRRLAYGPSASGSRGRRPRPSRETEGLIVRR